MLRLLMQAGLGFATFDIGRRIGRMKRLAVAFAIAGLIGLLGLGALTAAGIIYLEPRLGAAGAAAAVGAGLLVVAGLIALIGSWNPRPKRPAPIFDRVRAEVGAAGAAFSEARAARPRRAAAMRMTADDVAVDDAPPPPPGSKRKRALNMVLIATIAGVVLGRRL
ncbi:phage holin family protein [Chenggangzhangella methanolivorans]|uniref:Phage holin family protein n=1 Tax=Chenggangzhangella methanolivorans TaxID=1437009 RepID=A0A9E6RFC7_9HYPH|nr:phage holin family protein [Chenggangzhangella methanolivorans]QZO00216.1 phage holin family protein [Chenggangzhangella methanolivorans]